MSDPTDKPSRFDFLEINDPDMSPALADDEDLSLVDGPYFARKASAAMLLEDYERALALFSRSLQYDINMVEAWVAQVRCLLELGEVPEAKTWSQRALQRFPKEPGTLAVAALCFFRSGEGQQALAHIDQALQQSGAGWYAWRVRGECILPSSQVSARACFMKAIECSPADAAIYAEIGLACLHQHRPADALQYYEKATSLQPDAAAYWYRLGKCYEAAAFHDKAAGCYRQALSANSSFRKASAALEELEKGGIHSVIRGLRSMFRNRRD